MYACFLRIASIIALAVWLFPEAGAPFILSWFISDPGIVAGGIVWFRIFQSSFLLYGFVSITMMFFIAIGNAGKGALLAFGRQIFFFIPLAFILPSFFGEWGLWLACPLGDILAVLLGVFLLFGELKKPALLATVWKNVK